MGGEVRMPVHIISFTRTGFALAKKIQSLLRAERNSSDCSIEFMSKSAPTPVSLLEWTGSHFKKGNCLVFVGAAGIAVRTIVPFLRGKAEDPAVLVIDEKGKFVIPILSGHIGRANESARKIAFLLGGEAVITTASDVNNLTPIDEFASKNNLSINDMDKAKDFAAKMLRKKSADSVNDDETPPCFTISVYIKNDMLNLIPRSLILGTGCKKGKSPEELLAFVMETLENNKIDFRSLGKIASIDLKKDEKAILRLSETLSLPFVTFSAEELGKISQKVSHSDFVEEKTGVDNVCERSVFAAGAEKILVPKTSKNGMTIALGLKTNSLEIPKDLEDFLL